MNEYLVTFLYELANFVVFAVLLGWIFMKPVRRMLDEQAAKDKQLSETAKQHLAEADQLRQTLLDDRQKFNLEIEHQHKSLLQESQQQATALIADAKQQIAKQREQLRSETIQLQQAQLTQIAHTIADVSKQAVEKLLTEINGPPLEKAIVDSVCGELKKSQHHSADRISVESAVELDNSYRQQIAVAVGLESTNGNLQFQVVPDLIGGLRVRTSHGVIDNSIAGLSNFAGQTIRKTVTQTSASTLAEV